MKYQISLFFIPLLLVADVSISDDSINALVEGFKDDALVIVSASKSKGRLLSYLYEHNNRDILDRADFMNLLSGIQVLDVEANIKGNVGECVFLTLANTQLEKVYYISNGSLWVLVLKKAIDSEGKVISPFIGSELASTDYVFMNDHTLFDPYSRDSDIICIRWPEKDARNQQPPANWAQPEFVEDLMRIGSFWKSYTTNSKQLDMALYVQLYDSLVTDNAREVSTKLFGEPKVQADKIVDQPEVSEDESETIIVRKSPETSSLPIDDRPSEEDAVVLEDKQPTETKTQYTPLLAIIAILVILASLIFGFKKKKRK